MFEAELHQWHKDFRGPACTTQRCSTGKSLCQRSGSGALGSRPVVCGRVPWQWNRGECTRSHIVSGQTETLQPRERYPSTPDSLHEISTANMLSWTPLCKAFINVRRHGTQRVVFFFFWVEHLKGYIRFVEAVLAYCLLGSSSAHGMQSMAKALVYMCVHSPTNNTLNKLTIFFNVFSKFLTATVIYWSSFVELTVQILMFILIWKFH